MSKENNNLRLLGSPVNLSYRSKKKDDRKLIRNRPRSALPNSCITPDNPERLKRPFSADTKDRGPTTRNLLKAFSAELLQSYNNSPEAAITVKVLPPTAELLGHCKSPNHSHKKEKDICSNASDYGSEDTYISLGTKIKAKAQISPKPKNTNSKNFIKYRNIAKKNRKPMETPIKEDTNNEYNMEVKITEKQRSPSPQRNKNMFNERSFSPTLKTRPYESYFIPLENERRDEDDSLIGRVSFGYSIQEEVEQAIDTYSRRLTETKQQLSLVEEESTQDVDSVPSQNSISPEMSLESAKNANNAGDNLRAHESYVVDTKVVPHNFICEPRTYTSFYDDFRSTSMEPFKSKMSSTGIHTDTSSKDSGYPDSGPNDERPYKQNYLLPTTSLMKKPGPDSNVEDQPKSLDSASTSSNGQSYKTYPMDKKEQWSEPLNHSRLLYKDFFLKKEGHIALPPNNSPTKGIESYPGTSEVPDTKPVNGTDLEYPSYLVNSTTKAYTSRVIEDYKKELEAINSLHELALKDIKTDAISPTPLNIDKMFEDNANFDDKKESSHNSPESSPTELTNNNTSYEMKQRRDIAKISTKELIQNYLKVKEGDVKDFMAKTNQKKVNNVTSKYENVTSKYRQDWNNKSPKGIIKSNTQVNIRNPTQKNMFTMRPPLSARIDGVTNDKDIDSWMSLSAPSPRVLEIDNDPEQPNQSEPHQNEPNIEGDTVEIERRSQSPRPSVEKDTKSKELNSNSTVLDIYSMLKEIESYGDNPVSTVETNKTENNTEEDRNPTPKDNFMEIFQFLEKVEQSANDALSIVTNTTPQTIPNLEALLKLPQTELAQRLVTASLQLEERSCCIALLQESMSNHKEQMLNKMSNLERLSARNVAKVKQECEETIKRHQNFIDQLINDKKTLNHRIEQLVDERRSLEERWKRSAQALEERYKLELRNQHDKMAAAQQVARQRWVRQKAEKIKELTVKGLEGELREMAERQQKEVSDLKMLHAEQVGRSQARHAQELDELRRAMDAEREAALLKERQLASARLEKQILELEVTYQEQRTRLVGEMRAENERAASGLSERERAQREQIEKWRQEQEQLLAEKKAQMEKEINKQKEELEEQLHQKQLELEAQFEQFKKEFEAEQNLALKRKVTEISAQHKIERDREIEKAIESMEAEAQAGRKELQDAIRRNKEQYESELKELAETEQATLRRYQEAQARVRRAEDKCAELEVSVSQLETRNRVLTEKNILVEGSAAQARAECEAAWRDTVAALRRDADDARKTHDEQMHQLYAKVKVAVARKDSAIQALTREAAKYQEKIALLEQKLQQQRKDFLKHKPRASLPLNGAY